MAILCAKMTTFLLFLFSSTFVEGISFKDKIKRETNRILNQIKEDPIKVLEDVNRFLENPKATTFHILKRVLKIKEETVQPDNVVEDVVQASEMKKQNWTFQSFVKIQEFHPFEDEQDVCQTDNSQNCPSRPKETVTIYFFGSKDQAPLILTEDFLKDLKPTIISLLHSHVEGDRNEYITHESGVNLRIAQSKDKPETKIVVVETGEISLSDLGLPFLLKVHEFKRYEEDYQDFFAQAPSNCLTKLKEAITITHISAHKELIEKVFQEKKFRDLKSKMESSPHFPVKGQDSYVTHQPFMQLTEDSLEIGYSIIKTVEQGEDIQITFILSEITSPVTHGCQFENSFRANYLTKSTGQSGVQWWLGIQSIENKEVQEVLKQPQHLTKTQTEAGESYSYSIRTILL
jgi:hypothetical protein